MEGDKKPSALKAVITVILCASMIFIIISHAFNLALFTYYSYKGEVGYFETGKGSACVTSYGFSSKDFDCYLIEDK